MRPLIDASCYCAAIKVSSFYILKHGEMPVLHVSRKDRCGRRFGDVTKMRKIKSIK